MKNISNIQPQQIKNTLKYLLTIKSVTQKNENKVNPFKTLFHNNWTNDNNISKVPSNNIVYDEFIYTDKLTKKKIRMRQAKTSYEKGRSDKDSSNREMVNEHIIHQSKRRQSKIIKPQANFELQKQITDLDQCYLILKSTQMFKLNSLRDKLFLTGDKSGKTTTRTLPNKNNQNIEQGQGQGQMGQQIKEIFNKKKKIRQILEESVKQANLKEFRACYNDSKHRVDNRIFVMNRNLPKNFTKDNIQKIISSLQAVDHKEIVSHQLTKRNEQLIQFPGQNKFKTQMIEYMKKQFKNNGQYLIVPEKKVLLYQKMHKNIKDKQAEKLIPKQFDTEPSMIEINVEESDFQSQNFQGCTPNQSQKIIDQQLKLKTSTSTFKRKQKRDQTCIIFTSQANQSHKSQSKINKFLKTFKFTPLQKHGQMSVIKQKLQRNKKLQSHHPSLPQQRFFFLVQNGLIFDVYKEILMHQGYLFLKDKNQNNLLHICSKNHYTEMFGFILERLKKCAIKPDLIKIYGEHLLRDKLVERNKHGRTIFDVAKLYQADEIVDFLIKKKNQFNITQYP